MPNFEIFRINVSRYEEHLWKSSLQKNKYGKKYCIVISTMNKLQSDWHIKFAPSTFEWQCQSALKVLRHTSLKQLLLTDTIVLLVAYSYVGFDGHYM